VNVVVSHHTLGGWEEQAHKTCAAASVAGALNSALHLHDCGDGAIRAECKLIFSSRFVRDRLSVIY